MISPRLHQLLVRTFLYCNTPKQIPRPNRVCLSLSVGTAQGTKKDWETLAKKGLVRVQFAEAMSRTWGANYWHVHLTSEGEEELAEDLAREQARSAHVSRLSVPS